MIDLFEGNIDLAAAFDPERNGVNAAFRKFGDDINGALKEIDGKVKAGFKKMGDDDGIWQQLNEAFVYYVEQVIEKREKGKEDVSSK